MHGIIQVPDDKMACLYAVNSRPPAGAVELTVSNTQLVWHGSGNSGWDVNVLKDGEYLLFVCYSEEFGNWELTLDCFGETSTAVLAPTTGFFFGGRGFFANFQRKLFCRMNLRAGSNRISAGARRLSGPEGVLRLCAVDLLNAEAQHAVEEENTRAVSARADSSWMGRSGYGVMLHWTSQSQPRHGKALSYHDAVASLDVEKLAAQLHEAGASYLLFTFNHAYPTCPAPLREWESVHPGWTTERDLIADLAAALDKYGISLMLYINSPRTGRMNERDRELIDLGLATPEALERYLSTHNRLLEEIGLRYGDRVKGYWFDSWYQAFERFGSVPMERVYQAAKAGYAERVAAFNFWVLPVDTHWQDYWAGEVCELGLVPPSGVMEEAAFASLPYHALLILDDPWVHDKFETEVEAPHFSPDALADFIVRSCTAGGAVTVNMGVTQDGELGNKSLDLMRAVKTMVYGPQ